MKIVAVSLDNDKDSSPSAREVTVDKKRNQYRLISAKKVGLQDLGRIPKAGSYRLSLDEPDVISSEVELPPIRDKSALHLLVRKRLVEIAPDGRDYSFIIHENTVPVNSEMPTQISQNSTSKKKYNVFALSSDYLFKYNMPDSYSSKLNIVSLDSFSLSAMSIKADPSAFICHIFTDDKKVIMSFSKGHSQIYFRTTYIPEDLNSEEELRSFYFETINLTYLYIRQNRQEEVTKVILSGSIYNDPQALNMIEQLTSFEATVLIPENYLSNIDMATFQEYMLAIGAIFVDIENNFLPSKLREKVSYNTILIKLNIISFLILLGFVAVAVVMFFNYSYFSENLKKRVDSLSMDLSRLNPYFSDKESLIYDDHYIGLLKNSYETPITILYDSQDLLAKDNYRSLIFYMDNGRPALKADNLRTFATYSATYDFQQYYLDQLNNLTNLTVTGGKTLTLPQKVYSMNTELSKSDR